MRAFFIVMGSAMCVYVCAYVQAGYPKTDGLFMDQEQ